jgi:hypothetical protein
MEAEQAHDDHIGPNGDIASQINGQNNEAETSQNVGANKQE